MPICVVVIPPVRCLRREGIAWMGGRRWKRKEGGRVCINKAPASAGACQCHCFFWGAGAPGRSDRFMIRRKKSGMKKMAIKVAASMPPMTGQPRA